MWGRYDRSVGSGAGDPQVGGLMLGAFGALIGFSASSLANYNFGDSEVLMLLLAVVGLALAAGKSGQRSALSGQPEPRPAEGRSPSYLPG